MVVTKVRLLAWWPRKTAHLTQPGLQEAPPIGPQGTTKHPAPRGAAGFLEPSSSCVNSHCSVEQGSGFLFWEPWIISMGIISALLNNFSDLELFPFSLSALCHFLFPCSLILIILECFFLSIFPFEFFYLDAGVERGISQALSLSLLLKRPTCICSGSRWVAFHFQQEDQQDTWLSPLWPSSLFPCLLDLTWSHSGFLRNPYLALPFSLANSGSGGLPRNAACLLAS